MLYSDINSTNLEWIATAGMADVYRFIYDLEFYGIPPGALLYYYGEYRVPVRTGEAETSELSHPEGKDRGINLTLAAKGAEHILYRAPHESREVTDDSYLLDYIEGVV